MAWTWTWQWTWHTHGAAPHETIVFPPRRRAERGSGTAKMGGWPSSRPSAVKDALAAVAGELGPGCWPNRHSRLSAYCLALELRYCQLRCCTSLCPSWSFVFFSERRGFKQLRRFVLFQRRRCREVFALTCRSSASSLSQSLCMSVLFWSKRYMVGTAGNHHQRRGRRKPTAPTVTDR